MRFLFSPLKSHLYRKNILNQYELRLEKKSASSLLWSWSGYLLDDSYKDAEIIIGSDKDINYEYITGSPA